MAWLCAGCQDVVPSGARDCPSCGTPVPWSARRRGPSARTIIAATIVLAIGAFWILVGVDRMKAYIDALVEAFGKR